MPARCAVPVTAPCDIVCVRSPWQTPARAVRTDGTMVADVPDGGIRPARVPVLCRSTGSP